MIKSSSQRKASIFTHKPTFRPQGFNGRSIISFNGLKNNDEGDFFELNPTTWNDVSNVKDGQSTLFFIGRPSGNGPKPEYDRGYNTSGIVGDKEAWFGFI